VPQILEDTKAMKQWKHKMCSKISYLGALLLIVATSPSMAIAQDVASAKNTVKTYEPLQLPVIKAAISDHPRAVLKNGNHFLVMDETGWMPIGSDFGYGLYRDDTRYLSQFDLNINAQGGTHLWSSTKEGYDGRFIYTNAEYAPAPKVTVGRQKLMIQRDVVIKDVLMDRIVIFNFDTAAVDGELEIKYAADFADMFEVRGMPRRKRGELLPVVVENNEQVVLAYKGLDGQVMKTKLNFVREKPFALNATSAKFKLHLEPKGVCIIETAISTNFNEPERDILADEKLSEGERKYTYVAQKARADVDYAKWRGETAQISTDNPKFNELIDRDFRDLYMLKQTTPKGECLAAGTPWYAVAFGRDQEITGKETLAFAPSLARSVIDVLAAYQGTTSDTATEESPGKIMHELRLGEMARCKEIAFRPYFGSVDATPLWLVLLGEYADWTGDLNFVKAHWNNVKSALTLLDKEASTGYLVYGGKAGAALSNQGWKDSSDSIMDARGELAKAPIALCEVQGYLYSAWRSTAQLATKIGDDALAKSLNAKADSLKTRFNSDFYSPQQKYVAIALDKDNHRCDVISSNPGHLLNTDVLDSDKVTSVADRLMNLEMFCGWGIRTLSALDRSYNPISYHNGSVWPHDNAMAVEGLCKVGRGADGMKVMDGMFEAAQGHLNLRLPELFCGFSKGFSNTPVWYPVSCEPQAWAAGTLFLMLKSGLGLHPDAFNHQLNVVKPQLPSFLNACKLSNIKVGADTVTLSFTRENDKIICKVEQKSDGLKVVVKP
jgi:glycogen debranching enzyme